MAALDTKDRKILYELDLNSRQSFSRLAKKVGLSKDAVRYRITSLEEQGVIQRFHTVINVSKLGFISFRIYMKFYNWHCYYWWFFIVSVALHALIAVTAFGNPFS